MFLKNHILLLYVFAQQIRVLREIVHTSQRRHVSKYLLDEDFCLLTACDRQHAHPSIVLRWVAAGVVRTNSTGFPAIVVVDDLAAAFGAFGVFP